MNRRSLLAAAAVAVLGVGTSAQAQNLGVNFSGGAGEEGGTAPSPSPLGAADVAGVPADDNWNNALGGSGGPLALVDHSGAATAATVTWASSNTWGGSSTANPDGVLLTHYLDGGTGVPAAVDFAGLTGPAYDVYIYTRRNENPDGGTDDNSDYTVNGVTQVVLTGNVDPPFVLATGATIGNYVLFSGVVPAAGTINIDANLNAANFRSPVNGVQLVEVPEPASLGFLSLSALALLARRRKA